MKNRVLEFRKKKNYSQEQLGKLLGVSRQTIISIEKGKYNPSLPLAISMARVLDTKVEDLFILEEKD